MEVSREKSFPDNSNSTLTREMFAFEVSIHKKARMILVQEGYRDLLKFSTLFSVNLAQMFKESRYLRAYSESIRRAL